MNPSPNPAIFIHDTKRIIHANNAACELFRCEEWQLIDRDMLDFIPEDFKDLTRFNLHTTGKGKGTLIKPRQYDFVRCDGTVFSGEVSSRQLDDGNIETTVAYRYEVRSR